MAAGHLGGEQGTLGRFTATAFWSAQDGFGETNQVDLERPLAPPTLLRWSNSMSITEKENGWTWGTELSLLHKLSPKSAVTFAGGVSGSGSPTSPGRERKAGTEAGVGGTLRVEILFTGTGPDPLSDGSNRP